MSDEKKPPGRKRDGERQTGLVLDERTRTKKPPMYKVLLHNDDYTTREFVVWVLQTVFHKNEADAIAIMSHVHNNGVGVAGVYTFEVAETKVTKTMHAREGAAVSAAAVDRADRRSTIGQYPTVTSPTLRKPCCHPSSKPRSSAPSTTSAAAGTST